jgi:hypothetical protein
MATTMRRVAVRAGLAAMAAAVLAGSFVADAGTAGDQPIRHAV